MKVLSAFKSAIPVLFSLSATLASADPILWIDDSQGRIGTVDVETGVATLIGNAGVVLTDIAFNSNGDLYGVSFNTLYSINSATGAATTIGSLGVGDVNGLVFSSSGTLYASALSGNLYTVNASTGAATALFNTGYSSGGDLAFNSGSLYFTDGSNLLSINLAGATTSLVGSIGAGPVYGLATANDGILYAAANNGIYSLNLSTGAGTLAATYGNGLSAAYGTAFFTEAGAPLPPPPVPEPSTYLLCGMGLLAMGFARRRRII